MSPPLESEHDLSDIRLGDAATLIDPWETYRRLRDHAPVFHAPDLDLKFITRYDHIMEAIRDVGTYSNQSPFVAKVQLDSLLQAPSEIQQELMGIQAGRQPPAPTLIMADPPLHGLHRSQVSGLFRAGRIRKSESAVDQVILETIDTWIDEPGEIDFVTHFAQSVPLRIISDRLGVPDADRAFFYEAATAAASLLRMAVPPPDEILGRARLLARLEDFMCDLVDARREDPRDDLCGALAAARIEEEDRPFSRGEIWSIVNQFLVAGHETTTSAFGFAMRLLCEEPDLQERIRGDEGRIRSFVEEALRLESPVQGLPRLVKRDTELAGVPLAAGETVILRFGAANRDERQFPDPDRVDLDRKHPGAHLAFGSGTHHCPGAPLSRQELNRGILHLLDRVENLRLSPGRPTPQAEPSLLVRNLPELWIEFDRRAA